MTRKLAYLGPPGTFTEEALLSAPEASDAQPVPLQTVPDVIAAVASGEVDGGVVPIENSIEGSVNITLDTLAFGSPGVTIQREIVLPVRHALLARAGVAVGDIVAVVSHPHATAQCRQFLADNLPKAEVRAANSTAEAAQIVSERGPIEPWAAIGTQLAAELYGLVVVAPDIEDRRENSTRFVLAILHEFSDRAINLTKLESRPTKERLGEYCFFIDVEGHVDDAEVGHAIAGLRTKILDVRVMGSYPRAEQA